MSFAPIAEYIGLDFHIAGESYAGHFIPAIATEIVDGNNLAAAATTHVNLKSLLIGLLRTYLNRADIKHKVGSNVGSYFNLNYLFQRAGGWMRLYVNNIPRLLDQDNVSILIYAGDADFICNWIGNKAWTLKLEWSDREAWRQAEDVEWNQSRPDT
ncbi:Alpha/Beta hydrolase protein [Zychaea mexicana]|uniref:Alpha/Beta hydrolase protein n=1 Tax=Zychaea mexicana TaxID=64656 RepID=UPI0022FF2C17|nr:Alpha/Beta hydrolase protein [Zychaea mexicana]KAI9490642.1 Alpha/Beta hydrolase protein [Zychaea mexicana]